MPPFGLMWYQSGVLIHGGSIAGPLVFPVMFPGKTSPVQQVTLSSSAQTGGTFDVLSGVKFYLTGDPYDLNTVQGSTPPPQIPPPTGGWPIGWPNLGNVFTPQRPEMNGGFEISFDGTSWITFSAVQSSVPGSVGVGDQNDPSTWVILPATAIGLNGTEGILGPYDTATLYLRYVIPNSVTDYQVFDISLVADVDVV
jgi:hypothetical protein